MYAQSLAAVTKAEQLKALRRENEQLRQRIQNPDAWIVVDWTSDSSKDPIKASALGRVANLLNSQATSKVDMKFDSSGNRMQKSSLIHGRTRGSAFKVAKGESGVVVAASLNREQTGFKVCFKGKVAIVDIDAVDVKN